MDSTPQSSASYDQRLNVRFIFALRLAAGRRSLHVVLFPRLLLGAVRFAEGGEAEASEKAGIIHHIQGCVQSTAAISSVSLHRTGEVVTFGSYQRYSPCGNGWHHHAQMIYLK